MKALATLVSLAFGIGLLFASDKRLRPLIFFLALLAANQFAEMLRLIDLPGWDILLYRIASVAASFDPFVLLLFAAGFSSAPRYRTRAIAIGGGVIAFTLAIGSVLSFPTGSRLPSLHTLVLLAFTAAAYLTAATLIFQSASTEADLPVRLALGIATVPVFARLAGVLVLLIRSLAGVNDPLDVSGAIESSAGEVVGGIAATWVMTWITQPSAERRRPAFPVVVLSVLVVLLAPEIISSISFLMVGSAGGDLSLLGHAGAAIRWCAFAALISIGIMRHESLSISQRQRRTVARLVLGAFTIPLVALAWSEFRGLADPAAAPLSWVDAVVVLGALGASQSFRSALDRLASRLYDVGIEGSSDRLQTVGPANPDPDATDLQPSLLVAGRYRVGEMIARGGSGRVFRGRDELLLRDVALKEVDSADRTDERGLREARVAGSLDHPNVVTILDVVRRRRSQVIVSELVGGGDLETLIAAGSPGRKVREGIALGIVDGVAAVHSKGIIHRDIKPANILLTEEMRPKIGDFGIALLRRTRASGGADRVGTLEFMAPECRKGRPATAASDVYSLSCVLRLLLPEAEGRMAAAIDRGLHEDPAERWASAVELRSELRS